MAAARSATSLARTRRHVHRISSHASSALHDIRVRRTRRRRARTGAAGARASDGQDARSARHVVHRALRRRPARAIAERHSRGSLRPPHRAGDLRGDVRPLGTGDVAEHAAAAAARLREHDGPRLRRHQPVGERALVGARTGTPRVHRQSRERVLRRRRDRGTAVRGTRARMVGHADSGAASGRGARADRVAGGRVRRHARVRGARIASVVGQDSERDR